MSEGSKNPKRATFLDFLYTMGLIVAIAGIPGGLAFLLRTTNLGSLPTILVACFVGVWTIVWLLAVRKGLQIYNELFLPKSRAQSD